MSRTQHARKPRAEQTKTPFQRWFATHVPGRVKSQVYAIANEMQMTDLEQFVINLIEDGCKRRKWHEEINTSQKVPYGNLF